MGITQIPAARQPVVEQVNGRSTFTRTWYLFLQHLLAFAAPSGDDASPLIVSASPFSFTAPNTGAVLVSGGAVSDIALGRNAVFTSIGVTAGAVPVSEGDVVRVTYTGLPTITFVRH
jgi:hypothetical protein